ncbi:erythromycin esterase family protein [Bacillus sp. SM2101]|uniref:erythromycin esterase family protein n=1 Tax=Bacillus sp. SM2101 TaxID=2805366 RepID=UPI001BDED02C|nr:erythromycin esterase family protein [Bacillus sp. SM2101]
MKFIKKSSGLIIIFVCINLVLNSGCANKELLNDQRESSQEVINEAQIKPGFYEAANEFKRIELESDDYGDLNFLKDVLKDKRIVMLGESSHTVAEYNLIKSRLIKYLHEELDYNVIAFESGLADVNITNEMLVDKSATEALKNALWGIWYTDNNIKLLQYIKEQKTSNTPIEIAGVDIQPQQFTSQVLYNFFEDKNRDFAEELRDVEVEFFKLIRSDFNNVENHEWVKNTEELIEKYNVLSSLVNQGENQTFLKDDMKSLILMILKQRMNTLIDVYNDEYFSSNERDNEPRDKLMSENLVYLLEEVYPNEKFVVWAHNGHIMKNRSKIKVESSDGIPPFVTFVEHLPKKIIEESYVVGLYMYSGKNTYLNGEVVDVITDHKKNSIEQHLYQSGHPVTFLNIDIKNDMSNKYWWNTEATSKLWGLYEETFIPSEQYDGLILIKNVNPAKFHQD